MSSSSEIEERMSFLNRIWYGLATSFGASTLSEKVPGTYGTVPAVALWLLATVVLGWSTTSMLWVTVIMFVLGFPLVKWASRKLGDPDHPKITWDEMVGYFVAALIAPDEIQWLVLAFFMFRYMDMLKPSPVSWFDIRKGAIWVMLDDVVGGAIAGGWTLWIRTDPAEALKWLAVYIVASVANRLLWRWNRQQLTKWHKNVPPMSLLGALQKPVSAWPKWDGT